MQVLRHASNEKHGIAITEPELGPQGFGTIFSDVLGDRSRPFAVAVENVAQPRLAFFCAQEFIRSQNAREPPPGAGMAQTRTFSSFSIMPAKILKPDPGTYR